MYKEKDYVLDKLKIQESDLLYWRAIGHIKYSQKTDKYDIDSVLEMRTMSLGLDKILSPEQRNEVVILMEKQSSLSRRIFQDLQHNRALTANEYDKLAQREYSLKSYFGLSAHTFAKGQYESMNTWYHKTIENLENKIESEREQLNECRPHNNDFKSNFFKGKKKRIHFLENKLSKYQSKSYLSTWFGKKYKNDKEKYKNSRLNLIISGEEAQKGNRYIRIQRNKNNSIELKLFNHILPISIPKSHLNTFSIDEFNRQTCRISFNENGKLILNLTYVYIKPVPRTLIHKSKGVCGIDIGPKEVATVYCKNDGNPLFYEHYSIGNLLDKRSKDTKREISIILDEIIDLAIKNEMYTITIENLKFKPDHKYKSKGLNRMLSKFPRAIFESLLEGKCKRRGLVLKKVNPAYTSVIGLFKYSNRDNLCTSHNAKSKDLSASLAIARRGLGLKEKAIVSVRLFGKIISFSVKSLLVSLGDDIRKFNRDSSKTNSNWSLWSRLKKHFKTTDELTAHFLANPQTLVDLSEMKSLRCDSLNLALIKIGVVRT